MSGRRWLVLVLLFPALVWGGAAYADAPSQVCAGTAPDLCLSYGATVSGAGTSTPETRAAAPVDVALTLANSSPDHGSDTGRWLKSVSLDLLSTPTTGPLLTPSAQLPDGLLVAGSAASCGPDPDYSFSSCTAGHGTALVNLTGTGFFDGVHPATFGIQRVSNVAGTAAYAEYQVLVTLCISSPFGTCFNPVSVASSLTVPQGDGTAAGSTLEMAVSGTTTYSYGSGSAQADYSLDSIALGLLGRSEQLDSGAAADQTYDVLRLPATCGEVRVDGTVTDNADDSVSVPLPFPITGCPSAATPSATGTAPYRASFATAGASPIGRAVGHFLWSFGDGHVLTTDVGQATHTYAGSAARVVSVVAVDEAGARSAPSSVALHGSTLSLRSRPTVPKGTRTGLHGLLSSGGAGLAGRRLTLVRCTVAGGSCVAVARTTTGSGLHRGQYSFVVRVQRSAQYKVAFAGGPRLLGTRASRTIRAG